MIEVLLSIVLIYGSLLLLSVSSNTISKIIWLPLLIPILKLMELNLEKRTPEGSGRDVLSMGNKSYSDNLLDTYIDTDEIYRSFSKEKDVPKRSRNLIKHLYENYGNNQLEAIKYSVEIKLQTYVAKSGSFIGLSAMSISSFAIFISMIASVIASEIAIATKMDLAPYGLYLWMLKGMLLVVFMVVLYLVFVSLKEKSKTKRELKNLEIMLVCINQAQIKQSEQSKLSDLKTEA